MAGLGVTRQKLGAESLMSVLMFCAVTPKEDVGNVVDTLYVLTCYPTLFMVDTSVCTTYL